MIFPPLQSFKSIMQTVDWVSQYTEGRFISFCSKLKNLRMFRTFICKNILWSKCRVGFDPGPLKKVFMKYKKCVMKDSYCYHQKISFIFSNVRLSEVQTFKTVRCVTRARTYNRTRGTRSQIWSHYIAVYTRYSWCGQELYFIFFLVPVRKITSVQEIYSDSLFGGIVMVADGSFVT